MTNLPPSVIPDTLAEIGDLRRECEAWMNGVADAVEPYGYDREAACGPADLLPGLATLADELKRLNAENVRLRRENEAWRRSTEHSIGSP